MIRKYHYRTQPQCTTRKSHETLPVKRHQEGKYKSKRPSLPHHDDCKTGKKHLVLYNKTRTKHRTPKMMGATISKESSTTTAAAAASAVAAATTTTTQSPPEQGQLLPSAIALVNNGNLS